MTAKKPRRPKHQRKADRITQGAAGWSPDEIRCDYAIAPLDRLAVEMDRKWGVDRLVELVSTQTAEKYGSALAKLNAAIADNNPEMVAARASVCMRGLQAMDAEATQAGAQPATDEVWLVEADGYQFALMRDARAWPRIQENFPGVELISDREIVLALVMYKQSVVSKALDEARKIQPGAEIIGFGEKVLDDNPEDPLPF